MSSLATLKAVAENWLAAEKRYKASPNSSKLEQEAQEAFGEFVGALDGRTVLSLIDQIETMRHVADNFVWLAQNCVAAVPSPVDGPIVKEVKFQWSYPNRGDMQSLGEAVRVAMQQKSPILRVPG